MTFGRPTKYKPEYCQRLIDLCKEGSSRRALCAELEISAQTFYRWVKENQDFSDAYEIGEAVASKWYEEKMKEGAIGKIKGFNVMALTFLMKNRYPREFRDKQDVELTGQNGGPIQTESALSIYSTEELIQLYQKQKGELNVEEQRSPDTKI